VSQDEKKKPFAVVKPHVATQGVLPPGDDYEVIGWQVGGSMPRNGVFYIRKEYAESDASKINAAVEAWTRKAVVKAFMEAAAWFRADERKEYPECVVEWTNEDGGQQQEYGDDVADRLEARAAAIEKGEVEL
jgi:hypothetical protein